MANFNIATEDGRSIDFLLGERHQVGPVDTMSFAIDQATNDLFLEADGNLAWVRNAEAVGQEGVFDRGYKFRSMVRPDTFIDHASPEDMYASARMNAADIEAKVLELLDVAVARRA